MQENNPYASPVADVTQPDTSEVVLATRAARFVGALVDAVVMGCLFVPLLMYSGYWQRAIAAQQSSLDVGLMALLYESIFLTINGYILAKRGQTIGKLIAKTRIVDYQTNNLLPFMKVYALRYLPKHIVVNLGTIVGSVLPLVNVLFIFRKDRRCFHDLMAGTKVVVAG